MFLRVALEGSEFRFSELSFGPCLDICRGLVHLQNRVKIVNALLIVSGRRMHPSADIGDHLGDVSDMPIVVGRPPAKDVHFIRAFALCVLVLCNRDQAAGWFLVSLAILLHVPLRFSKGVSSLARTLHVIGTNLLVFGYETVVAVRNRFLGSVLSRIGMAFLLRVHIAQRG